MKGNILKEYSKDAIIEIHDMTGFVKEQHKHVINGEQEKLVIPFEKEYIVEDEIIRRRIGLE